MTPRYKIGNGRARHKPQHNKYTNREDNMAKVIITRDEDEDVIKVEAPYDDDWKVYAKEDCGAKWDPESRTWDFPDDRFTVRELIEEVERFFPKATIIS